MMVLGSEEKKGLIKALRDVFRDSTHLLCIKHLKDNLMDYMRNKCGINQLTVRNHRSINRIVLLIGLCSHATLSGSNWNGTSQSEVRHFNALAGVIPFEYRQK